MAISAGVDTLDVNILFHHFVVFDISQQSLSGAVTYISALPNATKEVDMSQSVSCRVLLTSHCCLCASSVMASLPSA